MQFTGAVAWSCRSCVWRCVSRWKPRLPCPCDPYGHCQRPCQGSAPYQLACSPLWLSLPARGGEERRKEKGGEHCLFVCLPALFYLGVFADHSSDWPRNVTVLCRAGVDSWFSDGSIRFCVTEREAGDTGPLMQWDVKCYTTVTVN